MTSTKNTPTTNMPTKRTRPLPTPAEHAPAGRESHFIHSGTAVPESIDMVPRFKELRHNAVQLMVGGRAARARKPDSGHVGTISITIRACRTRWNAMKPRSSAF
jgi:hypothetical protein